MKKLFKLLSFLLVVVIQLGVLPVHAVSIVDSGTCGENVAWTLDSDGLLTISGSGWMVNCPWNIKQVRQVIIQNGVKNICVDAFRSCSNLTNVTIPNSVRSINTGAFMDCVSLVRITIPDGVEEIGHEAFRGCTKLRDIKIPSDLLRIGQFAFRDTAWYNVQEDGLVYLGNVCIGAKNYSEKRIQIREGTRSIGEYAFSSTYHAMSYAYESRDIPYEFVSIPNSVTYIGSCAFAGCENIKQIDLGDGLTTLGNSVFFHCDDLTDLSFPDSLVDVYEYALDGCRWLDDQPDGIINVGRAVYGYKGDMPDDTVIRIKNGIRSLTTRAFQFEENLVGIYIPESINDIGYDAIPEHTIIYGMADSHAQEWAEKYGRTFRSIEEKLLIGDVSNDGNVSAEDARLALRSAVGLEHYEIASVASFVSDASGDGAVTSEDARLILRAAVGLEQLN